MSVANNVVSELDNTQVSWYQPDFGYRSIHSCGAGTCTVVCVLLSCLQRQIDAERRRQQVNKVASAKLEKLLTKKAGVSTTSDYVIIKTLCTSTCDVTSGNVHGT